jgi:hypothetical protein
MYMKILIILTSSVLIFPRYLTITLYPINMSSDYMLIKIFKEIEILTDVSYALDMKIKLS